MASSGTSTERPASDRGTILAPSVLYILIGTGAGLAFLLAWLPVRLCISRLIVEDMFYYLQAARQIAVGNPASLDGIHTTNGFHPLWMLICVGVQSIFDGHAAIHASLTLCATFFVATGWFLLRAARLAEAGALSLLVAAFFLTNYRLMAVPLGGLETALAGLMISAVSAYVLSRDPLGGQGSALVLGLLLGVTILARMDAVLLAAILLTWLVIAPVGNSTRQPVGIRLVRAVLAGIVIVVTLIPWFLWSWTTSQSLLPNSRVAIKLWTGIRWDDTLPLVTNGLRFAKDRVSRLIEPANDMANALGVWPFATPAQSSLRYVGPLVLAVALLALAVLAWRVRRSVNWARVGWIPIYVFVHVAYYVVFGRVTIRYLYPVSIPLLLFIAVCAAAWLKQGGNLRVMSYVFATTMVISWIAGVDAFRRGYASDRWHPLHDGLYSDLAPWIAENTPEDAIVGSFNSGILSYHCGRPVVNLDGVMNDSAIPALRDRKIGEYLDREGIDYLADLDHEIEKFMDGFSGVPAWRETWKERHRTTREYGGGVGTMDLVILERAQ